MPAKYLTQKGVLFAQFKKKSIRYGRELSL